MKRNFFLFLLLFVIGARLVLAEAAPDPIRLATGARPLGMGKAFVGLADDLGSVFLNPAGLANPLRWQVTSMSGKLLEEYNYLSLSGLYPTQYGNLGISYVGSSISGALPTTVEAGSDPADPIYTVDLSQDPMSYYNNLLLLSYGTKLDRVLKLPLLAAIGERFPGLKNVNFGANLKLFSVNLTGDGITQGNASGTELDLGLQGKPLPWLSLGGNIQNALPFSLGGRLHYESGWDESYPAVLKLGTAIDVLGPDNSLRSAGNHRLKVLADYDYEISLADTIPALWHLGLEWKPLDLIAVRAGIDQEMVGIGEVANNFTSGVGVYYGDFRFDYAYHQFAGAPGVDNHFFSLSYGIAPVKTIKDRLVSSPDKLITTQLVTMVKGTAVDPQIVTVKVNGLKTNLSPRGEFQTRVSLKVGKNAVKVEGFDAKGKLIDTDKLRILRLITYPDVVKNYWAYEQINYIGTLGIIKGYPDGKFKPEGNITRAELSTLLMRTSQPVSESTGRPVNRTTGRQSKFKDVSEKHWAVSYIAQATDQGIVKGYPDGSFKPSAKITRAEGLTMIARFGKVKQLKYISQFNDVTPRHWAAAIISGAHTEGMLVYLKGKPFEPNRKLSRAEAVEMLYRSRPVTALISDLLNFDKGY